MLAKPENKPVLEAFLLVGKVALVTGGNRGIGLDVCHALAEAGADVAIIYRSGKAGGEAAAGELTQRHGVKSAAYQADVADLEAITAAVGRVVNDFGHLDIVVANAGIGTEIDALDMPSKQFRDTMAVNLDGAFYTAQAAAQVFKSQGSGNLIFTTSMSAIVVNRPEPQAAYNASKAGLVHLAKSLAIEWVDFCRVNCISPGYIKTDMLAHAPREWLSAWLANSPGGRLGETFELKGAYVFCASEASSFMTGAHIVVDGGYSLP